MGEAQYRKEDAKYKYSIVLWEKKSTEESMWVKSNILVVKIHVALSSVKLKKLQLR